MTPDVVTNPSRKGNLGMPPFEMLTATTDGASCMFFMVNIERCLSCVQRISQSQVGQGTTRAHIRRFDGLRLCVTIGTIDLQECPLDGHEGR